MVQIIRKTQLPLPTEVPDRLREATAAAQSMALREPRPAGFPLLFAADMRLTDS